MENILIPIHVTHLADMDGIGCALISKFVFDDDTITQINPYTGEKVKTFWNKPLIIPVGNNVTDIMEEIEKLKSDREFEQDLYDFESTVKSYSKRKIGSNNNRKVIFLYIFTDINLPCDTLKKLDNYTSNLVSSQDDEEYTHFDHYSAFWEFDHHKTNSRYTEVLNYNDESCIVDLPEKYGYHDWFGIPAYASIVTSYMHALQFEFQPFLKCVYPTIVYNDSPDSDSTIFNNKKSISSLLQLLQMDGKSFSHAERSATYLYFMFLYNLNIFDQWSFQPVERLIWSVFHISNYDTFEFAKENPNIPKDYQFNHPDKFTVYFKQICNSDFFRCLTNLDSRIKSYDSSIPSGNDFFPFDRDDNKLLDYEYEKRYNEVESMVSKSFVITGKEFCTEMGIEIRMAGLRVNDSVAVITYPVNDPSHVGNTIVNKYNVKMVVMLYPDSRIVSFRSNNKDEKPVDCSVIAKRLGGGGHMFAAGCKLNAENTVKLLKLGWNPEANKLKDFYIYNDSQVVEGES